MRKVILVVFISLVFVNIALAGRVAPSSKGLPHAVSTANKAWAWFNTPATQCETKHEGSWTSNTGTYRGKFQVDWDFQTSTPYGRKMTKRFKGADHWPRIAQVVHAYTVWLQRSWHPWPPYYKFCYSKWPQSPSNWKR